MVRDDFFEVRHVPVPIVQEREVQVPKIEYVEKIIEVPQIQTVEKIVEVPQVQVQERIIHKPVTIVQEREVQIPEIEYVERIVEVPHVQQRPVEQVVQIEVPQIQTQVLSLPNACKFVFLEIHVIE